MNWSLILNIALGVALGHFLVGLTAAIIGALAKGLED
jgi:hypothetical protein